MQTAQRRGESEAERTKPPRPCLARQERKAIFLRSRFRFLSFSFTETQASLCVSRETIHRSPFHQCDVRQRALTMQTSQTSGDSGFKGAIQQGHHLARRRGKRASHLSAFAFVFFFLSLSFTETQASLSVSCETIHRSPFHQCHVRHSARVIRSFFVTRPAHPNILSLFLVLLSAAGSKSKER